MYYQYSTPNSWVDAILHYFGKLQVTCELLVYFKHKFRIEVVYIVKRLFRDNEQVISTHTLGVYAISRSYRVILKYKQHYVNLFWTS